MFSRPHPSSPETIALPWQGHRTPHATLDILRECNIACPGCFNNQPPATKDLGQLRRELDQLLALRRLHTITLSGGEPLLHPDLPDIIRLIRRRNLRVAILTNGLLLDAGRAENLRRAGTDAILLHIQQNQSRAGAARLRFQLLFNVLSGGARLAEALSFIAASLVPGRTLVEKHIVFQEGPEWLPDGSIDFCRDCPDATIRNGHLVPLCLADRIEQAP